MVPQGVVQISKINGTFFHSSGSKPNYDKPQKMGRLFSRKYEFGTPVETRNPPKFENRDFRWLLTFGIFGVSKCFFRLFAIFTSIDISAIVLPSTSRRVLGLSLPPTE